MIIMDKCKLGRHRWTSWRTMVTGNRLPGGERKPTHATQVRNCADCGKTEKKQVAA